MLLNKQNLSVADLAPKEGSRYTLSAVHVSEHGTTVTNGHYLVNVSLPTEAKESNYPSVDGFKPAENVEPFLLAANAAKSIAKSLPTKDRIPILNYARVGEPGENTLNIVTTDLEHQTQVFKPKKVTGQFPAWEKVLPTTEPAFKIALNADYLKMLCSHLLQFGGDGECMLLSFQSPDKGVLMETRNKETGQKWTALLMPMRADEAFIKGAKKPVQAADEAEEPPAEANAAD
jgi:hypothetical protein